MNFELQCNQTVRGIGGGTEIREYLCSLPHNAVFEVVVIILWYSLFTLAILNVLEFVSSISKWSDSTTILPSLTHPMVIIFPIMFKFKPVSNTNIFSLWSLSLLRTSIICSRIWPFLNAMVLWFCYIIVKPRWTMWVTVTLWVISQLTKNMSEFILHFKHVYTYIWFSYTSLLSFNTT